MGDYFRDNMELLDRYSIPNKRIVVESEDPVKENARFIKEELDKIKGPLLIISHSKGGLEFLEVLVNHPEVSERVVGWVTMQSPFRGSVLADYFISGKVKRTIIGWAFYILGGDIGGMSSVGTVERLEYMKANVSKIKDIFNKVNFLQFISYIDEQKGRESLLELSRNFIYKRVGRNDGMVDIQSAILKDQDHVIVSDVDHLITVLDQDRLDLYKDGNKSWEFDRDKHFRAVIQLILESKF